ncbi:unnamed protein product, partial [marine sediment metagenome]
GLLLSIVFITPAFAEGWHYNWHTGKMDKVLDKADEISLEDVMSYYGDPPYASPPSVQSALDELGASHTTVTALYLLLDASNDPITGDLWVNADISASNVAVTHGFSIADKYSTVTTFTSAGINAAIDALGVEGGEVYLPEGTYAITAEIDIDANYTTLTGSGWGTILDSSASQAYGHVINFNAHEYITIQNLQIIGNRGGGAANDLINTGISDYCLIQGCFFSSGDD